MQDGVQAVETRLLPLTFRTCISTVDVTLNTALESELSRRPDLPSDPNVPTDFDAWVHGQLLSVSDSFNTL